MHTTPNDEVANYVTS